MKYKRWKNKAVVEEVVHFLQRSLMLITSKVMAQNVDGFVQPGFNTGCVPP
jgi:hypothetical protein